MNILSQDSTHLIPNQPTNQGAQLATHNHCWPD